MIKRLIALFFVVAIASWAAESAPPGSLYSMSARDIDGEEASLQKYAGKVTLVVNTASKCGFTPQYQELETIYQKYKDKGLVVLAFPSNDFVQEPGSNSEIKEFCEKNFRVTFPIFSKNKVVGDDKQPIYRFLSSQTSPVKTQDVRWNFEKFLVDKSGKVVAQYRSTVKPTDDKVEKEIERLLGLGETKPKTRKTSTKRS